MKMKDEDGRIIEDDLFRTIEDEELSRADRDNDYEQY